MSIIKLVAKRLEKWYDEKGRRFPWRESKDPYKIIVVEFLLQRTRAETIEKVYAEFFRRFPSIESLATAKRKNVERVFSKLGLLYRATRLIDMARFILEKHGGHIPCDLKQLLRIKGVGVYISSAVLNFGYDIATPVIDKNVMRVANRLWGVKRQTDAERLVRELYKYGDHKKLAYALIDLGALVCKDRPQCRLCPLNDICPKLPLSKRDWRMLRKVITARGEVLLREQPVMRVKKKDRG